MIVHSLVVAMAVVGVSAKIVSGAEPADVLRLATGLKIDGSDADWPAAAARQALVGPDGRASIRLAADATNLYALVDVVDASPLKNTADRAPEALKGGDAVSLFVGGKPGQEQRVLIASRQGNTEILVHRPKSVEKKPHTFSSPVGEVRFDYVGPLAGAQAVLKAAGSAYVAEVAMPWKSLGFDAAPEMFPFDAQVIFSDPAGTTNVGSIWLHATDSPAQTVEDLPTEARLYPQTWGVARVTDTPRVASTNTPEIGAAQSGVPIEIDVPVDSKVSLIVLSSDGAIVRELLQGEDRKAGKLRVAWDGRDRYGEALPPGTYQWKAAIFDGMRTKFLGSVGASGRPPYRTRDGLGAIGGQHGRPTSLAADAGGIYMSNGAEEGQPAMRKIDAVTGKALWKRGVGGFGAALGIAADGDLACFLNVVRESKTKKVIDLVRIDPATGKDVKMGDAPARLRLNVPAEVTFGGIAIVGRTVWFSIPAENRIAGVDLDTGKFANDLAVPAPMGLSKFDANTLLVCTGNDVVKLNVGSAQQTPLLTALTEPRHAIVDPAGNIYVSQLGMIQQISKFSPAGKPLATFGREGGKPRTQKQFDPLALQNITALAIGPDNHLWMCETTNEPKRFVKTTLDGKWVEDFYGPVAYNVFGPDLDDFSTVYYNPGGNESAVHLFRTAIDYDAYRATPENPAAAWKITASYDLTLAADGTSTNELMVSPASTGYGHVIAFTASNGKRFLFRTSKHNRAKVPNGAGLWIWENDTWQPAAFLSRSDKDFGPSWTDANADGMPQDSERYPDLPTKTFAWIDRDLVLHGFDGTLAPASINSNGVPDYRGGKYTPYLASGATDYRQDWTFVSPQADGAAYFVSNVGPGRKMSFWDRADEARVMKVQDGKFQWIIGDQAAKPLSPQFSTMSGIAGVVDGIMLVHNVEPGNYVAITTDGLTLGDVMRNENGERDPVGPDVINIENFTGLYAKDPKTGRNVLFSVSSGDDRILEIVGPKRMSRASGEIRLDTSRPRAASDAAIPYQTWYGNGARGIAIDALATEWEPQSRGFPLTHNGVVVGDVRLRRDAGNLYVLAGIPDPTPFETGEGVTLTLASISDPTVAATITVSTTPGKADTPLATVRVNHAGKESSPKEARAAVAPRWNGLGYRIEAEIPLSLLPGLASPTRQTFRRAGAAGSAEKDTLIIHTAELPDLPKSLRLGITLNQVSDGKLQSITWPTDGSTAPVQAP